MADRFPRYRPLGVSLAPAPRIDYARAGAAEARGYQQMSSALDRMADYAFKEAMVVAEEKGAKYGAANPPTKEQIEDARRAGEDAESVLPGDSFTAYGRAARKAALESLAIDMEIDARNQLSRLKVEAEQQDLPLNEFRDNLDAMLNGYSEALSAVSPSAAKAFNASMAQTSNSAYMARAGQIQKDADARNKLQATNMLDTLVLESVPDAISAGSMVDANGNEYPLINRIEIIRDSILRVADKLKQPELGKEYLNKFNEKINAEMVGTVTAYISENPVARRIELQKGKFSDGHVQDVYDNMTLAQREVLRKDARTLSSNALADEAALDSRNERHRDRITDNLRAELADADAADNDEARAAVLARLKQVNPEVYASKVDGYTKETLKDDPDTVVRLERLKFDGTLTVVEVDKAFRDGLITSNTVGEFFTSLNAQRNDGFNKALTYVKNEVGYPDRAIINPSIMQNKAIQEVANIENQLIKLQRENPNADFFTEAQRLSAAAKQRLNGDREDALTTAIDAAISMLGLPEGSTEQEVRRALAERIGRGGSQQDREKFTNALTKIEEASR